MTQNPGMLPVRAIAYPLLIECDSHGHVLWMSEQSRLALSHPQNLRTLVIPPLEREHDRENDPGEIPASNLQFWRVLEMGDRVLISAQPAEPAASAALREVSEMLRLEMRMLQHYFRLQVAERNISGHLRKKSGSGLKAVRLVEMERGRIARDLHTGVGQILAAIRLQLEIIAKHYPHPPNSVRQALESIGNLADSALEQVRSISQRLHPPEWQRLSLPSALQQLWAVSGIPQRFEGELRVGTMLTEPHPQIKVLLYRAAQEALSNLLHHAHASRVDAELNQQGDQWVLSIEDNGVGFDVPALESAPASVASGIGLRSISELAAGLGGKLQIKSGPFGTKLVVSVPCSLIDI